MNTVYSMFRAPLHAQIPSCFPNPGRASRVVVCNQFADQGGTFFGRAGQKALEFGDCLRNSCDLATNPIAVELHKFENFSEKVN
jgi:hypothetical protein